MTINQIEVPQDAFARYLEWYEKGKKRFKPLSFARDAVYERLHNPRQFLGRQLPWTKTHETLGLRTHEFTVWGGVNGHGKSGLVTQVAAHLGAQRQNIVLFSPEMPLAALGAKIARQVLRENAPPAEALEELWKWAFGKLWAYEPGGQITPDAVLAACHFARTEMEIDHFFIDSLMKVGIDEDDYNTQKRFVNDLAILARETGVHVHLVCHVRKSERGESVRLTKFDIKGTGTITDLADNVFLIARNRSKERVAAKPTTERTQDDLDKLREPDVKLICDKNRHGEWEGAVGLWWLPNCQQLVGAQNAAPLHLVPQLTYTQEAA